MTITELFLAIIYGIGVLNLSVLIATGFRQLIGGKEKAGGVMFFFIAVFWLAVNALLWVYFPIRMSTVLWVVAAVLVVIGVMVSKKLNLSEIFKNDEE